MNNVDRTLAVWRSVPFQWGHHDCMMSIGNYIAANGGKDVTGLFRDTYHDEKGALAAMARYGGPHGLIDLTGIPPRLGETQRGDVVVFDTGTVEVGALCTGDGIAARLERGVVEVNRRLVRITWAWTVG